MVLTTNGFSLLRNFVNICQFFQYLRANHVKGCVFKNVSIPNSNFGSYLHAEHKTAS